MAGRSSRTWRAGWCRPTVNQLWVADITYVRLAEAFVYLAVVLDALQPPRGRLGDGRPSAGRAGAGGAADGAWAAGSWSRAAWSITPTAACSMPAATTWQLLEGPCDPAEHEPAGLPLRQRDGGELHEDAQAGGGRRPASIAIWPMREHRSERSSTRSTTGNGCTRRWTIWRRQSSRRSHHGQGLLRSSPWPLRQPTVPNSVSQPRGAVQH